MATSRTAAAVAQMTDQGDFESLAAAVLREAEPRYRAHIHTGINASGKTIRDPLDGIGYLTEAEPLHLIAFHHTTAARSKLRSKWLSQDDREPGDVTKTAGRVRDERKQQPNLKVTLVLTSTQRPDSKLVSDVHERGRAADLTVDIWDQSRLVHFLDHDPRGQRIRSQHLGITQELLSRELFHELSERSLEAHRPPSDPATWVPRDLDDRLGPRLPYGVTFLVAGSGLGKTVASYRALKAHVEAGGLGLVLPHELVTSHVSLDRAIGDALKQLHPALDPLSPSPISFGTFDEPILVVVEDVNRASEPNRLLERLATWSGASGDERPGPDRWQLICPLWPERIASLADPLRRAVESRLLAIDRYTDREGCDAVTARALTSGVRLSRLQAGEIARNLGNDPLLIGLHEGVGEADPDRTIGDFINSCLARVESSDSTCSAAELHAALRLLAREMLTRQQLEIRWSDAREWPALHGDVGRRINQLAHAEELVHFAGPTREQRLAFRHDRVRQWVLADAVVHLESEGQLTDEIVSDPFFAEVLATALDRMRGEPQFLSRVASANPLALFEALRASAHTQGPHHKRVAEAIDMWIDDPASHDRSNEALRRTALTKLSETDSPHVPPLARKFSDARLTRSLALLRNGDLSGGVALCCNVEPGVRAPWRDTQIAHALLRHGNDLVNRLGAYLRGNRLSGPQRTGALRLAGHLRDPRLASAVAASWASDADRTARLEDYLWAFGQTCSDDDGADYLAPVLDSWAALPGEPARRGHPSPRDELAADSVRWAFHREPPIGALKSLVDRAVHDQALRWPIAYLLHGVDHPTAVSFTVREFAKRDSIGRVDEWRRAQEQGRPMSEASRELLAAIFQDDDEDEDLRVAAFDFWAATRGPRDLTYLASVKVGAELADRVLRARLERGDQTAIPALLDKLMATNARYWWWLARRSATKELLPALECALSERDRNITRDWHAHHPTDAELCHVLVRMPTSETEELLFRHWAHLRYSSRFVQLALFVATPELQDAAGKAIAECPTPAELLEHVAMGFGIKRSDHPGMSHEGQIRALAPHLGLVSPSDVRWFWEECNSREWYSVRRELLDRHVELTWTRGRAFVELDKVLERDGWIEDWVENKKKADVAWHEIVSTLVEWLNREKTIEALELVAAAIAHAGTRDDLARLNASRGLPDQADSVLTDLRFAVRRRTAC